MYGDHDGDDYGRSFELVDRFVINQQKPHPGGFEVLCYEPIAYCATREHGELLVKENNWTKTSIDPVKLLKDAKGETFVYYPVHLTAPRSVMLKQVLSKLTPAEQDWIRNNTK